MCERACVRGLIYDMRAMTCVHGLTYMRIMSWVRGLKREIRTKACERKLGVLPQFNGDGLTHEVVEGWWRLDVWAHDVFSCFSVKLDVFSGID